MTKCRVLHVTESLGGGVTTAILEYAKNSPFCDHYLLATVREEAEVNFSVAHPFVQIITLPRNPISAIKVMRSSFKKINPKYVHLHSSFAGAYGRLAFLPRSSVIYTPHCFSFDRHDISIVKRLFLYIIEQLLSLGGECIAGVSPREVLQGKRMIGTFNSLYLPNYATIPNHLVRNNVVYDDTSMLTVTMVGRLSPQKDPTFFLEVWQEVKKKTDRVKFIWLGGGDESCEKELIKEGINVSGWIDHESLIERLSNTDVYLHTAKWEGNPMSLLEASALNLPIVARDIPSLRSLGITQLYQSPREIAEQIIELLNIEKRKVSYLVTNELAKSFTQQKQESALHALYISR
ncbi:MAG: glycosyltransferase [Candidatus Thiodiazotropha sp. L084R]